MKEYTNNTMEANEEIKELSIFQNYKKEPKGAHPKKHADNHNNKSQDNPTSPPNQNEKTEEKKKNVVEMMFIELREKYDFFNISNRHLYYYYEKEGHWRLIAENTDQELRRLLGIKWIGATNSATLSELYKWLLIDTDIKDSSVFNDGRDYLNFKDCAYNYKTGEVTTERQDLHFSYALNIDYPNNQESTGAFESYLTDIFGEDNATRREFSKFLALALSDIRDLKYVFYLYGPSNTSKSTMLNIIKYVVDPERCSSLSFSQLSQEFYVSTLLGSRLNISGEISGVNKKTKLDVLKSLSGNDDVSASFKFKDGFRFTSRCLMAFACNVLPDLDNYLEMQSYVSRMIIFSFRNVIDRKHWRDDFEKELREDVAGIVKFAIKGFKRLVQDNYVIHETSAMKLCKRDYCALYDSFELFCDKYLEEKDKQFTPSVDIKNAYQRFCTINDYQPLPDNKWPQILKRQFFCRSTTKNFKCEDGQSYKSTRGYEGVVLTKKVSKLFEEPANEDKVSVSSIFEK